MAMHEYEFTFTVRCRVFVADGPMWPTDEYAQKLAGDLVRGMAAHKHDLITAMEIDPESIRPVDGTASGKGIVAERLGRIPLQIVTTANGHVTEGVLAGVMVSDLDKLEDEVTRLRTLAEETVHLREKVDSSDEDAWTAAVLNLDAALARWRGHEPEPR